MSMINNLLAYKNTCFWFFVPILVFNIAFFNKLPEPYLRNISNPIVILETIARIITIAFSAIMAMNVHNKIGKLGLIIYLLGSIIYIFSYFIQIYFPNIVINNHMIVTLSPYWTSIIWLTGIGLIGNQLFFKIPYSPIIYIIISVIFCVIHSYHGYLCCKIE